MFVNITIKNKLLIPMIILTVILFFLGGMVIRYSYVQMKSLEKLHKEILLSGYISATIHSIQKERGLSSGQVENRNQKFKKELSAQRKKSDIRIEKLIKIGCLKKKILQEIPKLHAVREKVDKNSVSSEEVIKYYSNFNAFLLNSIVKISKASHVPSITQNILAYIDFLYLKEYGGLERAKGVIILSKKSFERKLLIDFTNLISIQNQNKSMFLKYANTEIKKFYNKKERDKVFKLVEDIRNQIIYKDISKLDIDPKRWYEIITQKLNILDKISVYIEKNTAILINSELKKVRIIFNLVVFLTIGSLVVFVLMLIAFLKLVREEQKLRLVTQKYIISSITDLKGKILDASDAFCEISGYSKSELIGQPHNIVRHPDMPKEAFRELWETIQAGKAWRGKVKNLKKDGGFYWVWANIEPLYDKRGHIDSYISIRLDITESELLALQIKEEEKKSRAAQDMMQRQSRLAQMGEMLSMIAHQWRQPLSAITATSGAISVKARLKKLDLDTAVELSNKIQKFSQHLSSTIDDFRDFFKANKIKKETNFKKITDDVLGIVKCALEDKKVEIVLDVKSYENFVSYENELKQVLLNLIKNSEDALMENKITKPTIAIEITEKRLSIFDNAGGIKEEIIDKIFDPYFSTKSKKDGTGLGLYMSKIIVEEHCEGTLSVKNGIFKGKKGKLLNGAKFSIDIGGNSD